MSSRDNNIKSNDSHEPKSSSHDDSRIPSAEVVNSEDDINARLESDCRIRDDDSDAVPVEESNNDSGQTSIWIIDEQYLKDIDKDLTEEEKQHRKESAEKLKTEGNEYYKNADYKEAARSYTSALRACPASCSDARAILYSNRAACFLYMEEKQEGISDCTKALEYNPNYLKALLRRALLYEKTEKLDEALSDYKKVLELEPRNPKGMEACQRLPIQINERNEKLKTEMLGKLKDLGNMFLKPFGLSTDHFKVQQDPSTGSYSINMKK